MSRRESVSAPPVCPPGHTPEYSKVKPLRFIKKLTEKSKQERFYKASRMASHFRIIGFILPALIFSGVALWPLSWAGPPSSSTHTHVHVVQEGETLSEILVQYRNGQQLWGGGGLVDKTWKLNQNVVKNEGDLIRPGTSILLPDELFAAEEDHTQASRSPATETETESATEEDEPETPQPVTTPQPAVPVTEIPEKPPEEKWANGSLTVMPTFSYFRLTSVDSAAGVSADLVSTVNPGLDFKWNQKWSDSTETFISGGFESTKVETDITDKIVNNSSNTLSHAEVGVEQGLGSGFKLGASVGVTQELLVTATSLTVVQLDRNFYPTLGADLSYRLVDQNHTAIDATGGAFILLPSTTDTLDVKMGTGYKFGVNIRQDISASWHLLGGANYLSQTQDTSLTTQAFSEVQFLFGVSFSY